MPQIVIVKAKKSVGIAIILSVLFGPLGLFYASVSGGFIMVLMPIVTTVILVYRSLVVQSSYGIVYSVVAAVVSSWLLFILYWFISVIWAAAATSQYNSAIDEEMEAILTSEKKCDEALELPNLSQQQSEFSVWQSKNPGKSLNDYYANHQN